MTDRVVTYQEMDGDAAATKELQNRSTIEFKVVLSTDHINERPRQCWSSGKVTRSANSEHGIQYGERNINTIVDIGPAIEDLAAEAEITIHTSDKAKASAQNQDIHPSWEAKGYVGGSHWGSPDEGIVWC